MKRWLFGALAVCLLLSGCGSSGTTETQAAAEGTTGVQDVTLKVWVPEEEKESILEEFDRIGMETEVSVVGKVLKSGCENGQICLRKG